MLLQVRKDYSLIAIVKERFYSTNKLIEYIHNQCETHEVVDYKIIQQDGLTVIFGPGKSISPIEEHDEFLRYFLHNWLVDMP